MPNPHLYRRIALSALFCTAFFSTALGQTAGDKPSIKAAIRDAEIRRSEFIEKNSKAPKLVDYEEAIKIERLDVPAPKALGKLEFKPEVLPEGANAKYPAYDGDGFQVTLPIKETAKLLAKEVLVDTIAPILKAMGFDGDPAKAFSVPPEEGIPQQRGDLKALSDMVAADYAANPLLLRPGTKEMLAALQRQSSPSKELNQAFVMGEGMTFAQYVAGIERLEISFPFQQVDNGIPIEHTVVMASRWQDQSVHSVWGRFLNHYTIINQIVLANEKVTDPELLRGAILKLEKYSRFLRDGDLSKFKIEDGPHLVLLPYGTNGTGAHELRHAYRMIVETQFAGVPRFRFLFWLDAENATILKLEPLTLPADANGIGYNRDPGIGTMSSYFAIDASSGGNYTLSLSGMADRLDYQADGYNASDIAISDSLSGSSSSFANFDQTPINDATQALCASGSNRAFQQVQLFSKIHKYRSWALGHGIFTPFPAVPWSPTVSQAGGCNAWASMSFAACDGYSDTMCPAASPGIVGSDAWLNPEQDDTVVAHEMGHNGTQRFTNTRPTIWCGMMTCAMPEGWGLFHDLADFWADHLTSTNCTAGWMAKNTSGTDSHRYCAQSDEDGGLPRLHELAVPFNPATPGDHFPEHRDVATGGYADQQIGTAILWQVRLGMRSKCRPSGLPQFGVRFARALKRTGFSLPAAADDRQIYEYLYDLEAKMTDEWATAGSPGGPPAFAHNGAHTANKVLSGFAKGGVFLIPGQCIDGDNATIDPAFCPAGEFGGDAVIDIDDNDTADDLLVNAVSHPETDFLRLGGPSPTFRVWTGSRYAFNASGNALLNNPSPCNDEFQVEVSTDPGFGAASTVQSTWIGVDRDPTTAGSPECYGTWTPSGAEWAALQGGGAESLLYYRATTRQGGGGGIRSSLTPGNGLWTVPPPYAVITTDGRSNY